VIAKKEKKLNINNKHKRLDNKLKDLKKGTEVGNFGMNKIIKVRKNIIIDKEKVIIMESNIHIDDIIVKDNIENKLK
jgi:hypothetical protein